MRNKSDEALKNLIRQVAIVVILALLAIIVLVVLLTPFLSARDQDTTLLLGLFGSLIGALLALFGIQIARRNGHDG